MRNSAVLMIMFSTLILVGSAIAQSDSCADSVRVGEEYYSVSDKWCSQRVDSLLRADPASLARLPDELAFEDYGIYLTRKTRDAFVAMANQAAKDSVFFVVRSGYRSTRYQREIIGRRLDEGNTFEEIIRFVAPPGYSTHVTGRALDLAAPIENVPSFAASQAYQWLLENASAYGFVETYPKDEPDGHAWEPWHWQFEDLPPALEPQSDTTSAVDPG